MPPCILRVHRGVHAISKSKLVVASCAVKGWAVWWSAGLKQFPISHFSVLSNALVHLLRRGIRVWPRTERERRTHMIRHLIILHFVFKFTHCMSELLSAIPRIAAAFSYHRSPWIRALQRMCYLVVNILADRLMHAQTGSCALL